MTGWVGLLCVDYRVGLNDIKHIREGRQRDKGTDRSEKKEQQNSVVVEWNLWYVLAGSDVEV